MVEQACKALKWCSHHSVISSALVLFKNKYKLKINKKLSFVLASVKYKWPSDLLPDEWIPAGKDNYSTFID